MTRDATWELIAEIGWKACGFDFLASRRRFWRIFKERPALMKDFLDEVCLFYVVLREAICAHPNVWLIQSDDGLSDLIYHIIGLGRKAFEKALADPAIAIRRYARCDYVESFAYAILPPNRKEKR